MVSIQIVATKYAYNLETFGIYYEGLSEKCFHFVEDPDTKMMVKRLT